MENVVIFQEMLDFSTPGSFKLVKLTFLYVLFNTVQYVSGVQPYYIKVSIWIETLSDCELLAFSSEGGVPIYKKRRWWNCDPHLLRQQKFYDHPPRPIHTPYPPKQAKIVLKSVFLNKINALSVVILWLPTFWSSKNFMTHLFFFPKIFDPPVYLGPTPFWRKCQPPHHVITLKMQILQLFYPSTLWDCSLWFCRFSFLLNSQPWRACNFWTSVPLPIKVPANQRWECLRIMERYVFEYKLLGTSNLAVSVKWYCTCEILMNERI